MARSLVRRSVVALAMVGLLASAAAEAQWVLLARRVVGRVETMSQTTPDGTAAFDVASVIVDVPVDKVYASMKAHVERAQATQGITVTQEDDTQRLVKFSKGQQSVVIRVGVLGDNLTSMTVSSARPVTGATANEPPPTTVIVERILAVCKELNVECFRPSS
jgi:hypothetical protein